MFSSSSERQKLLDEASKRIPAFRGRTIDTTKNNIIAPTGKGGSGWVIVTRRNDCRVELFWGDKNTAEIYFKKMERNKANIESEFGEKLYWDFKQNRKTQHLKTIDRNYKEISGELDEVIRYLVERMIKFMSIVGGYWDKVQRDDGKSKEGNNIQPVAASLPYLPNKEDFKKAYRVLTVEFGKEIAIDAVLDQIQLDAEKTGKKMKSNWRMITEDKIAIWQSDKDDKK